MNLLQQAKQIVFMRRQAAQIKAMQCYQNALNIAQVKSCIQKVDSLLPEIAKSEALNIKDEKLKKEYEQAVKEKEYVLKKYNIDEKDFLPHYQCRICNDTGYNNGEICLCVKQIAFGLITEKYGIDMETLNGFTDNNVQNNEKYKKCLEDKYCIMKKYCCAFPDTKYITHIMSGASGTGKTYLSCFVAKNILQRGFNVIFASAFKLNKMFLNYHTDFNGEYADYIDNLYECDLLIVDDLGTENTYKNVTCEYFLSLISERLSNNKHTIFTTNLGRGDIRERYGERLYSRLFDKNKTFLLHFDGDDLRQLK